MGDLLGSFPRYAQVRPKCAEKLVLVCRQLDGPGCYKWYQRKQTTMVAHVFSAPSGKKILKLQSNEDVVFLSGGECVDTPNLALKRIDRLLVSTRRIFFSWGLIY